METRFFRFLVSLIKNTQNISKGSFAFVPVQDLSSPWTDAMLYKKYGITKDEIAFIESMIRPVGLDNE
jgi:site-specific DNA-methyltransferase (adenine-specific)